MALRVPLQYPSVIQVRLGNCMFFLGDRWVLMGPVEFGVISVPPHGRLAHVPLVDNDEVDAFFAEREHLDDGSDDWRVWGPRVN